MRNFVLTWLLLILFDYLYLGVLRNDAMKTYFQNIGGDFPKRLPIAGVITWGLLALAVEYFVLPHATSPTNAAMRGALLGGLIYGVYDMTNWGTIPNWTLTFSAQDIAWGAFLMGIISFLRLRFLSL